MHYSRWSKNLNVHFGYFKWGMNPYRHEAMLQAMNKVVAELIGFQEKKQRYRILDMGCGFGSTTIQMLDFFPNSTITGININEEQIAFANERKTHPDKRSRATFLTCDFQTTPFADKSFDAAYCLETACYGEGDDKANLINEVARLLTPGGRFAVVDGFRKHGCQLPRLVNWLYKKNLAAWSMPCLAQIDAFEQALSKNGFKQIKIKDISWNMLPSMAYIPFAVLKLFFAYLIEKDGEQLRYLQALLWTLTLVPFKQHFAYYTVTCVKSTVEFKN